MISQFKKKKKTRGCWTSQLRPSYQSLCFFIFLVVGLPFSRLSGGSEWWWFCILVIILMWWEAVSTSIYVCCHLGSLFPPLILISYAFSHVLASSRKYHLNLLDRTSCRIHYTNSVLAPPFVEEGFGIANMVLFWRKIDKGPEIQKSCFCYVHHYQLVEKKVKSLKVFCMWVSLLCFKQKCWKMEHLC